MRAVQFERFGERPTVREVAPPEPGPAGVLVRVEATGLCRSDIHGWLGHDDDIVLPHVPGHEFVGRIAATGTGVAEFRVGERVTVPFVCACGRCPECRSGNGQVCRNQTQPGFTHDGSFSELVLIEDADYNLIRLPDDLDAGAAALLGCRFATAYRGLALLARLQPAETVLVLGCGGVGLSVIMIAVALGAQVIAVDVDQAALDRAAALGAETMINSRSLGPAAFDAAVRAACSDGVPVTVDALGREDMLDAAIRSLSARGRHVQIGLLPDSPVVRMSRVIGKELALLGSHGLAARDYPGLLDLVFSGRLRPQDLVTRTIGLDEVPAAMADMAGDESPHGVTIIRP
jgi:D-arabinose 1-dehydrogenase-like Zn-dependent alcohol dehydrogenase